jgi:site-specific recombinase XerD
MTPLRQRLIQDLQLRNYSPRTVEAYVHHAARFARHFGRSPEHLGPEQAREYQLHLLGQKASWSRFNQAVAALRFLYSVTLRRPELIPMLPYGKRPKTVPCVLSQEEVLRLFDAAADPVFRVLLQTTYACGLRAGEVVRLRLTDLDSQRMVVQVRQGKGRKDRLVPLSPGLLGLLRDYWRQQRPREWLFPGGTPAGHRSLGQVQRLCRRAVLAAGITKRASLHTLRHSYATHLLEAGVDLLSLQKLLGHNQVSTTVLYTHVQQSHLHRAPSPLDTLLGPPAPQERLPCPPCPPWPAPAWMSGPPCADTARPPEPPAVP